MWLVAGRLIGGTRSVRRALLHIHDNRLHRFKARLAAAHGTVFAGRDPQSKTRQCRAPGADAVHPKAEMPLHCHKLRSGPSPDIRKTTGLARHSRLCRA